MNDGTFDSKLAALDRAVRVSDQSCTAYAHLRDKYQSYSFWLDISTLLLSAWLVSMVFVQPHVLLALSPKGIPGEIWIGLLSILVFSLSIIQLQVDWKGRSQLYHQAVLSLSAFVKENRNSARTISELHVEAALARYSALSYGLEPIPERLFLALKRKHRLKLELSRLLDDRPGANLLLWRLAIVIRDNRMLRAKKRATKVGGEE